MSVIIACLILLNGLVVLPLMFILLLKSFVLICDFCHWLDVKLGLVKA